MRLRIVRIGRAPLTLAATSIVLLAFSFLLPAEASEPTFASRLVAVLVGGAGVTAALEVFLGSAKTPVRRVGSLMLASAASLLISVAALQREGARSAIISVAVAVTLSAVLFVSANRLLDQAARRWILFTGLVGTIVGALLGLILVGNKSIGFLIGVSGSRADRSSLLVPVFALTGLGFGLLVGSIVGRIRIPLLVAAGVGTGALTGAFLRVESLPSIEPLTLLVSTVAGAAVFGLGARWRKRPVVRAVTTGAAFGWLIGSFGFPDLGGGTVVQGLVGTVGIGALVGLRTSLGEVPELSQRIALESRLRAAVFLAPALIFVSAMLVIPTIRTMYLALLDRRSDAFVGLDNFRFIFAQPSFLNLGAWRSMTDSTEFLLGSIMLLLALAAVMLRRVRTDGYVPPRLFVALAAATMISAVALAGRAEVIDVMLTPIILLLVALLGVTAVSIALYVRRHPGNAGFDGPGGGLAFIGVLLLLFAVFTNLRGTLMNNLWWVVVVTIVATGLGLAIAALADRSGGESVAKSLIFMPMALSFVGASIIWRFMYISRLPDRPQTGVLNAAWVGLGLSSVSDRAGVISVALFAIAALLIVFGIAALRSGAIGSGWSTMLLATFLAWFGVRFSGGQGVAGASIVDGQVVVSPIIFLDSQQFGAYNNIFVMVPFIWIYTGFAMVIFSAAIKAIPADLLEAGRVDGATDSQSFWRIVMPQIRPTVGVVLTTIIVVVMKVFDIVKVMTNGQFGTQVLANEMWNRSFLDGNFGVGSAVAVVLFLSVLPVMFVNIRRMQKEAA